MLGDAVLRGFRAQRWIYSYRSARSSELRAIYIDEHSPTLAIDIDVVRALLGCWLDHPVDVTGLYRVDDHSHLVYSEILPDREGSTCAAFLTRAARYFTDHGIPRIERVMTDNAWSYRHSQDMAAAISSLNAMHKFIKPHCPWQNRKVERLNRTLQTERAYRQVRLGRPIDLVADRAESRFLLSY